MSFRTQHNSPERSAWTWDPVWVPISAQLPVSLNLSSCPSPYSSHAQAHMSWATRKGLCRAPRAAPLGEGGLRLSYICCLLLVVNSLCSPPHTALQHVLPGLRSKTTGLVCVFQAAPQGHAGGLSVSSWPEVLQSTGLLPEDCLRIFILLAPRVLNWLWNAKYHVAPVLFSCLTCLGSAVVCLCFGFSFMF